MAKVLLIEDDPVIGRSLALSLEPEGYRLTVCETLAKARASLAGSAFDLILLDLNLPDGNGLVLCTEIRERAPMTPIIMITARVDESDAVKGLKAGANDYIRKPFGTMELVARIQKVMGDRDELIYRTLTIDVARRTVKQGDQLIPLGRREFDCLCILVRNAERIVNRDQMLKALNLEEELFDRTVDSHLSRLRKKLAKANVTSLKITSVYGIGYRLEPT